MTAKKAPEPLRTTNGTNLWHWTQIQKGNVFMQAADSRMLALEGFAEWKKLKIKDSSLSAMPEGAYVLYDRAYIVGKIQTAISDPLRDLPIEALIELLLEAHARTIAGNRPRDWELPEVSKDGTKV